MPRTTEKKTSIVKAYFWLKSIHAAQLQFKERFTLWTTEIIRDTTQHCCSQRLLSTSQASLCDGGVVRSLESIGSPCGEFWTQVSTCIITAGWCYPSPPHTHFKGIIGMATAAFPWSTEQPQVWPRKVVAFTGLEPPRFLSLGIS